MVNVTRTLYHKVLPKQE